MLEKVVDEGKRYYDPKGIFRYIMPNIRSVFKQRQQAANYVKVRTATVTPIAIYFNSPILKPLNRIIRRYRYYEDRFLRVKFIDEKYKGKVKSGFDNS